MRYYEYVYIIGIWYTVDCIILCNVNNIHEFHPHLTEMTRTTQRFTSKAIFAREAGQPVSQGKSPKVGVFRRSNHHVIIFLLFW